MACLLCMRVFLLTLRFLRFLSCYCDGGEESSNSMFSHSESWMDRLIGLYSARFSSGSFASSCRSISRLSSILVSSLRGSRWRARARALSIVSWLFIGVQFVSVLKLLMQCLITLPFIAGTLARSRYNSVHCHDLLKFCGIIHVHGVTLVCIATLISTGCAPPHVFES